MVIDGFPELTAQLNEFPFVQLAEEHAVLGMVPVPEEHCEHVRPALVVCDVVRHDIVPPHHFLTGS
jgi:hypothetical protein